MASLAAIKDRGFRQIHLFDVIFDGTREMVDMPYRSRYAELHRSAAILEQAETGRTWSTDRKGQAHGADGRYSVRVPSGWRRAPVVEQVASVHAERLWDTHVGSGGEGLVVVALDAPMGARRSKRKCKVADTLDCEILDSDGKRAVCRWRGAEFTVGCAGKALRPGDVVEMLHDGWYSERTPRFPRIVRIRPEMRLTPFRVRR